MNSALDWLRQRRRWTRLAPAAVVVVALLVLMVRNAETPSLPDYEVPEGFTPAPPPTTAAPGAAQPDLAAVGGTTTTFVPPNVGRARLSGVVTGPGGGVVPGAVVRIERNVAGTSQVLDAVTGADGRYDAPGIGGGRYRVRAFLAPTLAQAQGTVLFLGHDEDRPVDLAVAAYAEPAIAFAVAPDPPLLDGPLNVAVRVSGRLVDTDGVVRTQPLVGGTVTIVATGGWVATGPTSGTTDGDGEVRVAYECRSTAPTQLQVTVRLPVTSVPFDPTASTTATTSPVPTTTTSTFEAPACVDPATLTTTTTTIEGATSTSTPDPSSTTTTTAPPSPTSVPEG